MLYIYNMLSNVPGSGVMRDIKRRRFNKPMPVKIVSRRNQVAKRVRQLDKRVKKLNRKAEVKHFDIYTVGATVSTTATFVLLNGMAQGDTAFTRTGNDVSATSVQGRFSLRNVATQTGPTYSRIIIFWDQQANGAAPASTDLLDLSTISSEVFAPYNSDNQKRFKIVWDRVIELNSATGTSGAVLPFGDYFRMKRKLSRIVKYDAAAAGIASIASNSLYLMYVGDIAPAGANPLLTYATRFNYKDD